MAEIKWTTVPRRVRDLVKLGINPRRISDEAAKKLAKSLQKFGLAGIPIVDLDGTIISGNQRVSVLVAMGRGDEIIDVRMPSRKLSDTELKEYAVTENTHAGEWDFQMLLDEFGDIDLDQFEIDGLDAFAEKQNKAEDDGHVEVDVETVTTSIVAGDLIQIGRHRLLCGSSTEAASWRRVCGFDDEDGALIDCLITDPPYNVAYVGKTKDALTIENDSMEHGAFFDFLLAFHTSVAEVMKPGAALYIWHADTEGENFRRAFRESGNKISGSLVWVKNTLVMGRSDYQWKHEPCLYGWKEGGAHNWYSDRKQTTVLEFKKPSRNGEHPTMKPVELIAYQMQNSSKKGDRVADGFLGSGTTMVAAEQLGRECVGIELDPRYCQVIVDRMRKVAPGIQITKNGEDFDA